MLTVLVTGRVVESGAISVEDVEDVGVAGGLEGTAGAARLDCMDAGTSADGEEAGMVAREVSVVGAGATRVGVSREAGADVGTVGSTGVSMAAAARVVGSPLLTPSGADESGFVAFKFSAPFELAWLLGRPSRGCIVDAVGDDAVSVDRTGVGPEGVDVDGTAFDGDDIGMAGVSGAEGTADECAATDEPTGRTGAVDATKSVPVGIDSVEGLLIVLVVTVIVEAVGTTLSIEVGRADVNVDGFWPRSTGRATENKTRGW
ncbi:hypothetical protein C8Q80DRAFT_1152850 [Daedaleopsis nitida]|nr:hypothetical protein C8Q80DRAFT_1152850 [Daedaleopsis nitida]